MKFRSFGIPIKRNTTNIMLRLGLLLAIFLVFTYLIDRFHQPYVFSSVSIIDPVIHAGDKLQVQFIYDRQRICKTETTRMIFDKDGKNIYSNTLLSGSGNLADNIVGVTLVPTDENLNSGVYRISHRIVSTCSNHQFVYTPPDIYFQIIDKQVNIGLKNEMQVNHENW